jgi:hypothetical protein
MDVYEEAYLGGYSNVSLLPEVEVVKCILGEISFADGPHDMWFHDGLRFHHDFIFIIVILIILFHYVNGFWPINIDLFLQIYKNLKVVAGCC